VYYSKELPSTGLRKKQVLSTVLFLIALVAFACLLGIFFRAGPEGRQTGRFQTVGDFPDDHAWFNTSHPLSLYDQLRGHVTVLYFEDFETLSDLRGLSRLAVLDETFADDPMQVIVVYRISRERLPQLYSQVETWDIHYPVIIDDGGVVGENFGISGIPALLLIDSTARVSAWYYHGWEQADLETVVYDLLTQGVASRTLAMDPFRPDGGEFIPDRLRSAIIEKN
jgi:hypothetical protein